MACYLSAIKPMQIIKKFRPAIWTNSTSINKYCTGVRQPTNTETNVPNTSNTCNVENEGEEFRKLLRNSNFINLGDPEGKVVTGTIFQVVDDDLYIDFGWKFYCVCARPSKGGQRYVRGAEVLLRIKSLELSSHFLGAPKALTLLEADAHVVSLISSPIKT